MVDKFFQIQRDIHHKREGERLAREQLVEMKKAKLIVKRSLVSAISCPVVIIHYRLLITTSIKIIPP